MAPIDRQARNGRIHNDPPGAIRAGRIDVASF
jgi:hypothetical protein